MRAFICAADVGSSITKAALVDATGAVAATAEAPSPAPQGPEGPLDAEAQPSPASESSDP